MKKEPTKEEVNARLQENADRGFWMNSEGNMIPLRGIGAPYAYKIVEHLVERGYEAPKQILNILLKSKAKRIETQEIQEQIKQSMVDLAIKQYEGKPQLQMIASEFCRRGLRYDNPVLTIIENPSTVHRGLNFIRVREEIGEGQYLELNLAYTEEKLRDLTYEDVKKIADDYFKGRAIEEPMVFI